MEIKDLIRQNILSLKPYSSARDDFNGEGNVFLDANENPFSTGYNRYPDPHQRLAKQKIGAIKGVAPNRIFLGNGSDEAIDIIIRMTCEPGKDNILVADPSYGMYEVSAGINDVELRKIILTEDFQLDMDRLFKSVDDNSRVLFLCSPNNPTGNLLNRSDLQMVFREFPGLIVLDEAYVDFSAEPSFLNDLDKFAHLIILQTFSKAWGMAGLRVGCAYGSEELIGYMNKIKPPYNINQASQQEILRALDNISSIEEYIRIIIDERKKLVTNLEKLKSVQKVFPSESNFLLVRFNSPQTIYRQLVKQGIIVRDRSSMVQCEGCLRITIGTPLENDRLIKTLRELIA